MVKVPYKTGQYAAEVMKEKGDKMLVKVLAVLKHPKQGDLHQPNQVDVALFHERKALAHYEKVWVPKSVAKPFEEELPSYEKSLIRAVDELKNKLSSKEDDYSKKALDTLKTVEKDYAYEANENRLS